MVWQRYMRNRLTFKIQRLIGLHESTLPLSSRLCRYCTNSAPQVSQTVIQQPTYEVCSSTLNEQSNEDICKFYKVDEQSLGPLTSSLGTKFIKMTKATHQSHLLIRKPALDILSTLNEERDIPPRFIIYGPDGSGKTLTMLHVIHACLLNNWLLVHVPRGEKLADSKSKTPVVQSTWNTNRFDHPEEAIAWLQYFSQLNRKILSQMSTSQEYLWGKREKTEKGKSLLEVLEQGVSRSVYSTDAVGVLLREIQLNQSVNVLYAVDGFNGLYGCTRYQNDGKPIDVANLSLVHHFSKLLRHDRGLNKGAYVLGLSRSIANLRPQGDPTCVEDLLPAEAFQLIGPHERIMVQNYDSDEFTAILNYYRANQWITRDLSDDLMKQLKFLTNCNPKAIRNICASL